MRFKDLRPGGTPRDWVDEILDQLDVPFAQRSEVREFASMDQSKQLVWLYVQSMKRGSTRGVALNVIYTTALAVAYAVLTLLHGGSPFGSNGGGQGP